LSTTRNLPFGKLKIKDGIAAVMLVEFYFFKKRAALQYSILLGSFLENNYTTEHAVGWIGWLGNIINSSLPAKNKYRG
jgi:hypothetical protein